MFDMLYDVNHCAVSKWAIPIPFSNPLYSPSFPASSNLRKSLVFCARSLRCVRESRWCAMTSEAVESSFDTSVDKSMPAKALRGR